MEQPHPTPLFTPAIAFARNRETAPAYWMLDVLWLVLVDGRDTNGAYSVMEQWMHERRERGNLCEQVNIGTQVSC
jgi:hypothetical protein